MRLTSKGYRLATTVQGPATGKGAHLIIVDDPFKAVEAASDAVRNSVYDWFKGSLMTRFDNPAEGAVIVVMQRLHQDDLVGRLKDEGGWEYLAMPGEFFERTVFDLGGGESWTLNPGDLLYPARFNRDALDQLAFDLGEAQFNAQILQRPSPPGGALIKPAQAIFSAMRRCPAGSKQLFRAGIRPSSTRKPPRSRSAPPGASSAASSI